MRVIAVIALIVALTRCAQATSGGIVDNGNHPKPNDPVTPDASVAVQLIVLNDFVVAVPSNEWKADNTADSTTISDTKESITFRRAASTCEATLERTEQGIDIFWCSTTRTVLGLGDGTFIDAEHTARTTQIEAILRSFRRK